MTPYVDDGDVTLYLGQAEHVLPEIETGAADCTVTSPPYLDARPEYPSPSLDEFTEIFVELDRITARGPLLLNVGRLFRDGEELMWWLDLVEAVQYAGWRHRDTLVWFKPNGNPIKGEIVTDAHEYVFLFGDDFDADAVRRPYAPDSIARMGRKWINNRGVKGERSRGTVTGRPVNELGARSQSVVSFPVGVEKGNPHPAPMPVDLATHLLRLAGGDTVIDPFCGSGTTGIAARGLGRRAILIEQDEDFLRLAAARVGQQQLFPLPEPVMPEEELLPDPLFDA